MKTKVKTFAAMRVGRATGSKTRCSTRRALQLLIPVELLRLWGNRRKKSCTIRTASGRPTVAQGTTSVRQPPVKFSSCISLSNFKNNRTQGNSAITSMVLRTSRLFGR